VLSWLREGAPPPFISPPIYAEDVCGHHETQNPQSMVNTDREAVLRVVGMCVWRMPDCFIDRARAIVCVLRSSVASGSS
jgi:hypothetical protein